MRGSTAALFGAPYFVPAAALGKGKRVAPSNRVTLGCIGLGLMGNYNLFRGFLPHADCRVLAVCDVDDDHARKARDGINKHYGNDDCDLYHNFRDLLARDDIDGVVISTPDHWHAIPAIAAARSGKDIYGEKPFSHSLVEGQAMVRAVERHGRIWQTGSWQRSLRHFQFACELVRNGRIGQIHTVEVGIAGDYMRPDPSTIQLMGASPSKNALNVTTPPPQLDYEMWVGPARYHPYISARTHVYWRWNLDFGGGDLMDWIGHHNDIAHWGLGVEHTGPVEVEANGEFFVKGPWFHIPKYTVSSKYRRGFTIHISSELPMGTKWIGQDGWIYVNRNRTLDAEPKSLLDERIGQDEIHLAGPVGEDQFGHHRNFLDCIKSRRPSRSPAAVAHRSASPGHLGLIAMKLGRKIRWNPDTEQVIGDDTASRLLGNAHRSPWRL